MRNRIRRVLRALVATNVLPPAQPRTERTLEPLVEIEGVIEGVDSIGRELPIRVGHARINLYVPFDCRITLNDEYVRMRHLQANDRARLVYSIDHGIRVAHAIAASYGDNDSAPRGADAGPLTASGRRSIGTRDVQWTLQLRVISHGRTEIARDRRWNW